MLIGEVGDTDHVLACQMVAGGQHGDARLAHQNGQTRTGHRCGRLPGRMAATSDGWSAAAVDHPALDGVAYWAQIHGRRLLACQQDRRCRVCGLGLERQVLGLYGVEIMLLHIHLRRGR
ncbi:hypothetical protein [Nonomuraea aridisoli]|uniref:Uncharacterized protein n=1 Tax=Nonomuraea aridisoli TaxID=2070368 RepID=A0A2W2E0U7_9ACTN|nr:hypothetical protein [Nonomuraea aridisoli]PZG17592.1 hypothetical protein C1J01_17740 [Nonomuraea aridisoli]